MSNEDNDSIAIIAMECRIPQADNVDALWELLRQGRCTLTELSDDEVAATGVSASDRANPAYVKRAGVLADVDKFDAEYFEMNAREADILDVQQRLMLESAVTLLNRGNVDPSRTDHRIGVFAGSAFSSYLFGVLERGELVESLGEMLVRHGNDKDFLATRISYKLNLTGPSLNVQTSCSTGLVAVHSACQSLLLGECDLAIAGAVSIKLPQHTGYKYQPDGVLSPDGMCRPFDASANGTIFTNGLGLVLLKRLRDAMDNGDEIAAVIAGSAINNDGSTKVGFTAPSVRGQIAALRSALELSGVDPAQVQYIEAHGTGTALGDPIEVEAIKEAYGLAGRPCGIGSLKGNFGHFNVAAGIIGLIKATLALKHKLIPATINIDRVNPGLGIEGSRFYVTDRNVDLDTSRPQYAAVSAFGMGGTNCHVVLRSHDDTRADAPSQDDRPQLFTFSAKSEEALARLTSRYIAHFEAAPEIPFADSAFTARVARPALPMRAALVARNAREAAAKLRQGEFRRHVSAKSSGLAFVFGGQGTQHVSMGQELARRCAPFRRALDEVVECLGAEIGFNPYDYLWQPEREEAIASTLIAQPLLFAVEYATARTLLEAGVSPQYVMGHSLGELVAATVSGVFDLGTAAAVVAHRARYMDRCEAGAMLAVDRLDAFESLIDDGSLAVAARNSPRQMVLSGSFDAIEAATCLARVHGVTHQRLKTSHAFHSPMMRTAAKEFASYLKTVTFGEARIPVVSNITGRLLTEYEYKNPIYWSDHLQRTVQFADSITTLRGVGVRHYIEVGPGHSMSNLLRANIGGAGVQDAEIAQVPGDIGTECASLLDAIAMVWTPSSDLPIDAHIDGRRKVQLPVYPFARTAHWIEPVIGFRARSAAIASAPQAPGPITAAVPAAQPAVAPPQDAAPAGYDANPVEAIVGEIYSTYLGGSDIDRETSFFDLGGNSLVAVQMINKLRETFQIDIPLRGFFQNSSVFAISRQIAVKLLEEPADA
jgi:phthiocerol/phenolphthiocerol synthesis type-I polyketide synthase E